MVNIIGWGVAIGLAAISWGFWDIQLTTFTSFVAMLAALYAAGTSYDNFQKLRVIQEDLYDIKKNTER